MTAVTISIPTLNEESHLPACLADMQSAIDACESFSFDLHIVDSHSHDRTIEIAEEHPVVDDILYSPKGILTARDHGIREAAGDIVVCIDADTRYPADFLQTLLAPFANDETVLTYGRAKGKRTELHIDTINRRVLQNGLPLLGYCWVNGSNRAIDKAAYERRGGYDLSKDSDSVAKVMYEEQFRFPLELRAEGTVAFVREAESFQSHRSMDQLLMIGRKEGGRSWDFMDHYNLLSRCEEYVLEWKDQVLK